MNIRKILSVCLAAAFFTACSPGTKDDQASADVGTSAPIENVDMKIGTSMNMTTGQTGITVGTGNGVSINPANGQLSVGVGSNLYINPANGQLSVGF
jgi:hypothetical protein